MNQVTKSETQNLPVQVTPMQLMAIAIEKGADVDKLEKLMALQERYEANEARKQFVSAMNAFKSKNVQIEKNNHVKFQTSKGVTEYRHATLDNVVNTITEAMVEFGLSFSWDVNQQDKAIAVTCLLRHVGGHTERITLSAYPDETGGKNSIQAVGSTVSYLQRYTLLAATGLATREQDDDAQGATQRNSITVDQALELVEAIKEKGLDEAKIKGAYGVSDLRDIPADRFAEVLGRIKNTKPRIPGAAA